MGAFARWLALTRRERRLVLESAGAITIVVAGLRLLGARRMLRLPPVSARGNAGPGPDEIRDHVAAIERAGRYIPGGTCLTQSLALARILRRRGVAAYVRIGVKTAGALEAHAWVEADGEALTDAPDLRARFAPIN